MGLAAAKTVGSSLYLRSFCWQAGFLHTLPKEQGMKLSGNTILITGGAGESWRGGSTTLATR
jgi:hypothetical protein